MTILLLTVIYIAFISLGLPDSLFGTAWPLMHTELNLDASIGSLYMIIVGAGTASVSFIAGPLIRKIGTGWVTAISVLLTAVGLAGMGFSKNIILLVLSSIAIGIGAGAVDTGLNDFVSKHYKPRHMNWLHCFWGVGVTLSPLIMSVSLSGGSWRTGYLTVAAVQGVLAFIMFASLPLWKRVTDKHKAADLEQAVAQTDIDGYEPVKADKRNLRKIKGVPAAALAFAIYCGMEYIIGVWGASYLINVHAMLPAKAAAFVSGYYGGIMAGRFIAGFLTAKLSNKFLIRCGIGIAALGALLLCIPAQSFALPGLMLIGLGFAPVFPCSIDSTKTRFGHQFAADIIGIQMGTAYVGAFISQLIVGFAATRTTFMIVSYVLLAMCAAFIAVSEYINRVTAKKAPVNV